MAMADVPMDGQVRCDGERNGQNNPDRSGNVVTRAGNSW